MCSNMGLITTQDQAYSQNIQTVIIVLKLQVINKKAECIGHVNNLDYYW